MVVLLHSPDFHASSVGFMNLQLHSMTVRIRMVVCFYMFPVIDWQPIQIGVEDRLSFPVTLNRMSDIEPGWFHANIWLASGS